MFYACTIMVHASLHVHVYMWFRIALHQQVANNHKQRESSRKGYHTKRELEPQWKKKRSSTTPHSRELFGRVDSTATSGVSTSSSTSSSSSDQLGKSSVALADSASILPRGDIAQLGWFGDTLNTGCGEENAGKLSASLCRELRSLTYSVSSMVVAELTSCRLKRTHQNEVVDDDSDLDSVRDGRRRPEVVLTAVREKTGNLSKIRKAHSLCQTDTERKNS